MCKFASYFISIKWLCIRNVQSICMIQMTFHGEVLCPHGGDNDSFSHPEWDAI